MGPFLSAIQGPRTVHGMQTVAQETNISTAWEGAGGKVRFMLMADNAAIIPAE